MTDTTELTTEIPSEAAPAVETEVVTPPAAALAAEAPKSILGGATADAPAADGAADSVVDPDAPAADAAEGGEPAEADATPFEGLKAPEGFAALDETALNEATPILRELGADTPEKAQVIIDKFGPMISGIMERQAAAAVQQIDDNRAALVAQWANEVRADPDFGGAKYDRTLQLAGTFMDRYFGPKGEKPGDNPHRDFMDDSGLGNNPGLVKAFAKAAAEIADGTIHTSEAAQPAKGHKMYDDVFLPPKQRRG
jgi:hypothetical protein